jgi:DNA processing protein
VSPPSHQGVTESRHSARVLLALLQLPGIGRKTARRLLDPQVQPFALEDVVARWDRHALDAKQIEDAYRHADSILDRSDRERIRIVTTYDVEFPQALRSIDDPPLILHVKGSFDCLNSSRAIAIIGTRQPTDYGKRSARRMGSSVARSDATVVSGLALGCDSEAHWGCLDANGRTVAVLAHGLDQVYPAQNQPLASEILARAGCLISEYEIGKPAFRTTFVERDRLQSGLAQAVILIETGLSGGSLHTARFARQQGRALACLRHPDQFASEERAKGNRKLIQDGVATPIDDAGDLQNFLRTLPATPHAAPATRGADQRVVVEPPIQGSLL